MYANYLALPFVRVISSLIWSLSFGVQNILIHSDCYKRKYKVRLKEDISSLINTRLHNTYTTMTYTKILGLMKSPTVN